jgi:DeoR family fructose operon transcriptional repressor
VADRVDHGQSAKTRIARKALEFVQDGETLFLDSGRTVSLFAEQLRAIRHLTVITNSPPVLACLGSQPGTRLILVGGEYSDADRCCVGTVTEKELGGTYVSKVIMGADGIDIESAAVFARVRHFGYIQAVIRNAKQTVLLAESTKFDRIQGLRIVDLAQISTLVTDAGLAADVRHALERMGIVLAIAA